LQAALSFEDYRQLLPSLEDLRVKYNLDPEIVFMASTSAFVRCLVVLLVCVPSG
jgi:Uma2 family endonuclease